MEEKQMEFQLDLSTDYVISQDNSLVMGNYDMTAMEQKIFLILLSTIKKDDKVMRTNVFRIVDLAELMNVSSQLLYRDLKKICKSIIGKIVEIQIDDKNWDIFNIVSGAKYNGKQGTIELTLNDKAIPYLLQLEKLFTQFKLKNALFLESKYSIRIYQMCKSFLYRGEYTMSLEEFKKKLKLTQKSYDRYNNLKNNVLEPAIKEISEKSDIKLQIEEIKIGRKVEYLKFIVKNNASPKRIIKSKPTKPSTFESSFNNFEPRQYDYDKLEKKLLGWE